MVFSLRFRCVQRTFAIRDHHVVVQRSASRPPRARMRPRQAPHHNPGTAGSGRGACSRRFGAFRVQRSISLGPHALEPLHTRPGRPSEVR
jgi:hypothetical protein